MMIALHKNARTAPAIRGEIASGTDRAARLAQRLGTTDANVYKRKQHTSFLHCSPTACKPPARPHKRAWSSNCGTLRRPLEDLLAATREFSCAKTARYGLVFAAPQSAQRQRAQTGHAP